MTVTSIVGCGTVLRGRYGNVEQDGVWRHWDHEVLPHWTPSVSARYPQIGLRFRPPLHLHSPFFPLRGPYSSLSPHTVAAHFQEMAQDMGVGVAVVSWWGRPQVEGTSDTQGVNTDSALPLLFQVAQQTGLQLAFHLEPYPGRTVETVRLDVLDLLQRFSDQPSLYRRDGCPVFYVYDSYHIAAEQWARLLTSDGDLSIRANASAAPAAPCTGIFLALWLNQQDGDQILQGGFDGAYSYFAAQDFSFGSSPRNWRGMSLWAQQHHKLFVPSVGPGYMDSSIRPWNAHNTRPRADGQYYDDMWREALDAGPSFVSLTSYNEWGEGTQLEPAVAKAVPMRLASAAEGEKEETDLALLRPESADRPEHVYQDYGQDPFLYVKKTNEWVMRLQASNAQHASDSTPTDTHSKEEL
eukprot:g25768.t1